MHWHELARGVHWNVQPFIGGKYLASASEDTVDNINPANETVLCSIPAGSAADIDRAVRVAREAFDSGCWSDLPPLKRGEILMRLADLIVANKNQLALLDSLEMGKPIQAALFDAEQYAPKRLRSWAGFADKLVGETAPIGPEMLLINAYEPRGVVGAITPWNFPALNAVFKFGPALAAGNTMVLKPSELASSSTLKLAELALQAGVPPGVLNVVPGLGSTVGMALALHADVNLLSFTGSTATGRRIMEFAARSNGKPVLLECGGKSPQLVFEDASDLDVVAEATASSFLANQGQVCSARTRLIVHARLKDALVDRIVKIARKRVPGDPLDENTSFGPLASPLQRDRVKAYIEQGIRDGAVPVLKGAIRASGGCYVSPTVFDHVTAGMSIVREEIFGPVLCVQSFASDDEAIALANGTDYGLEASVWTRDMARARRCARAIKAGEVLIRTGGKEGPDLGCVLGREPQKASGFGSESGLQGLKSYSTLKMITFSGA
jgi:acyl-CoA reductase-like NAD-dependent aldehyde dehydrogenase